MKDSCRECTRELVAWRRSVLSECFSSLNMFVLAQCSYLEIAALAAPTAVRNLEVTVEAHLQVAPLMGNDLPGTLHVGWEVLGVVW